jgi:hypothetical protein
MLRNARCKFKHEFDVELHVTVDDREFMARRNVRHEASGMAEMSYRGCWHRVSRCLIVRCPEFVRRFTGHQSIDLISSLY